MARINKDKWHKNMNGRTDRWTWSMLGMTNLVPLCCNTWNLALITIISPINFRHIKKFKKTPGLVFTSPLKRNHWWIPGIILPNGNCIVRWDLFTAVHAGLDSGWYPDFIPQSHYCLQLRCPDSQWFVGNELAPPCSIILIEKVISHSTGQIREAEHMNFNQELLR